MRTGKKCNGNSHACIHVVHTHMHSLPVRLGILPMRAVMSAVIVENCCS